MVNVLGVLKKYWWVFLLIAIVAFGIYVRLGAMKYSDLPDIDTYYWLRLDEYMLSHNLHLPTLDMMRNWPYGENMFDLPGNFYLPAYMYTLINPIFNMSFYRFAFIEPVILAAIAMFLMFFFAYELFGDKIKAMFATFFFAVIPAAITRLSSGEIEKEANSVVFMLLSFIFFIKSYKASGWKWKGLSYGILSGIFMGATALTWGGTQFLYILLSLFAFVLLLVNKPKGLWYSFIPTVLIGIVMKNLFAPHFSSFTEYEFIISYVVTAMVVIRELAEKFSLVKAESLKFLTPAVVIVTVVVTLIASMFIDFIGNMLSNLYSMITLVQPTLTTVAESIPGDWNAVVAQAGVAYSQSIIPQAATVSILLSVWLLMILGSIIMAYKFARYREYILIFPVIFTLISIYGVFYALRLSYFIGFSGALASGYFCGWLLPRAYKIKTIASLKTTSLAYLVAAGFCAAVFVLTLSTPIFAVSALAMAICFAIPGYAMRVESQESLVRRFWNKLKGIEDVKLDVLMIPVIIFVVLLVAVNMSNAVVYGSQLGPSINPYFDDSFKFLREQTPQNTSVLSWWDFGYWIQYVGQRATIVDGGGVGNTTRYDVALWFTDDASNWTKWSSWLNNKLDVGYILMDYTIPGKYGAISKIASHETTVVGIAQFDQAGTTQQGNTTIQEFSSGPYQIWIPLSSNGAIAGTPVFLATDGTKYQKIGYINDVCTDTRGIVSVGNESQTIGGCIAITPYGLFYVPGEAEHTIFTSLMFMDGHGLVGNVPTKVFDNGLIHIYNVKNTTISGS